MHCLINGLVERKVVRVPRPHSVANLLNFEMKRAGQNVLLVYGDSNGAGYPHNSRTPSVGDASWPQLLGKALVANGIENWIVHNDSVPGRSLAGESSAKDQFVRLIAQHQNKVQTPRLILVLALGTNDLSYETTATQIIEEINWYVSVCREKRSDADILYVTHPGIIHTRLAGFWERKFKGKKALEQEVHELLSKVECTVLDSRCLGVDIVGDDGLHFTHTGHTAMMQFIYPHVSKLILSERDLHTCKETQNLVQ